MRIKFLNFFFQILSLQKYIQIEKIAYRTRTFRVWFKGLIKQIILQIYLNAGPFYSTEKRASFLKLTFNSGVQLFNVMKILWIFLDDFKSCGACD